MHCGFFDGFFYVSLINAQVTSINEISIFGLNNNMSRLCPVTPGHVPTKLMKTPLRPKFSTERSGSVIKTGKPITVIFPQSLH